MKIAVCNENKTDVDYMAKLLEKLCKKVLFGAWYKRYNKGEILCRDMDTIQYDFIYLNLRGNFKETVQLLHRIRKQDSQVLLCLSSEYARQIWESNIWEPILCLQPTLFIETLQKFIVSQGIRKDVCFFEYRYKNRKRCVCLEDIMYFESEGRKITIHMYDGRTEYFLGKLSEIEKKFISETGLFIRVHQSYLVNFYAIRQYSGMEMILCENTVLPISKSRYGEVEKRYNQYQKSK